MAKMQNRTRRIQMLVSEKEKEQIERRSEETGLSLSSYMRRLVMQDLKKQRSKK